MSDMAVRGELHVPADITEDQLEEMEVDQHLHREAVAKLKQRLSIKIREQEALEARIRVARKVISDTKAKKKQQRMESLRTQRAALMRQQSEEAYRPDIKKDLTTEGIEPVRTTSIQLRGLFSVFILRAHMPLFPAFYCFPMTESWPGGCSSCSVLPSLSTAAADDRLVGSVVGRCRRLASCSMCSRADRHIRDSLLHGQQAQPLQQQQLSTGG